MNLTPEMIAAAWDTWHSRHGGKLGPGPAFVEAINAAIAIGTKREPALTCPHIDKAISSGELSAETIRELETVRDINSQLRFAIWHFKALAGAAPCGNNVDNRP